MERLVVVGGRPLRGRIRIESAKNAVLPIIAASLLAKEESVIEGVPPLQDVLSACEVLQTLGAGASFQDGAALRVDPSSLDSCEPPYELVRKMRASFLVMGPLLARFGRVRVSLPGGCAIGSRPIDLHLKGFASLGARIFTGHGCIEACADRLRGDLVYLDFPSVGATENILMAATLARGRTVIQNAAREPEVVDLANFLNAMGACITGAGTDTVRINGVGGLRGARHAVIPDRIEAATYMAAVAITGGEALLENVLLDHLSAIVSKLREAGVEVSEEAEGVMVRARRPLGSTDVRTFPYPGFPTDMQPQFTALMTLGRGTSLISETVFENRFLHVGELNRMGADVRLDGRTVVVQGVKGLTGAPVRASDLRGGAALVIAALAAEGQTEVGSAWHLDRGYLRMDEKLRALGAEVWRVNGSE